MANVFDLQARIGLDSSKFTDGIKKAASGFANLGKAAVQFGKITSVGFSAAGQV